MFAVSSTMCTIQRRIMSLEAELNNDMKSAMKSRDQVRLDTIRFLLSQLKNLAIEKGQPLSDAEVQQAIAKQVKQQREVIDQYRQAGRDDLVDEETAQVKILETYLPQQISEAKLRAMVAKTIDEMPNAGMGQIIGEVRKAIGGQADGARIASEVKRQLNQ